MYLKVNLPNLGKCAEVGHTRTDDENTLKNQDTFYEGYLSGGSITVRGLIAYEVVLPGDSEDASNNTRMETMTIGDLSDLCPHSGCV